jgi:hypothetical protein
MPEVRRVDAIVADLQPRLRPGDAVQVLEYGQSGGVHAMVRLGAWPATPFYTDFQFYHHVSTIYIQALRGRFLQAFDAASPRFVLRVNPGMRSMFGPDTTDRFPALEFRLASRYKRVAHGERYEVYERL